MVCQRYDQLTACSLKTLVPGLIFPKQFVRNPSGSFLYSLLQFSILFQTNAGDLLREVGFSAGAPRA